VHLTALLGIYSDPIRDSRGHTVTAVYVAEAAGIPIAADDAKNCQIFCLNKLPNLLAFDHAQVLADYKKYRETGQVAALRI
jgi:8-oxo-dGTP diphosphatase